MESLTLTLSMSIVHGLPETDSLYLNYWYLMLPLLIDFYALSLLYFPLLHFPPLLSAPAFSTPAFSAPPSQAPNVTDSPILHP